MEWKREEGQGQRTWRCWRRPSAAPLAKEAFSILGNTGDTDFPARWGVGCEGMCQAGIFLDGLV